MNFYAYTTLGRPMQKNLTGLQGLKDALKCIKSDEQWKSKPFVVMSYVDYYDRETWSKVYTNSL